VREKPLAFNFFAYYRSLSRQITETKSMLNKNELIAVNFQQVSVAQLLDGSEGKNRCHDFLQLNADNDFQAVQA
jgi:hypothetical protein